MAGERTRRVRVRLAAAELIEVGPATGRSEKRLQVSRMPGKPVAAALAAGGREALATAVRSKETVSSGEWRH